MRFDIRDLKKGKTMTVQTVIFYNFFKVIEVNRHRCISVGILSFMSLSVARTSGLL